MTDSYEMIARNPEQICRDVVTRKPTWVTGSISGSDAQFLFSIALEADVSEVVEIGTASGFSTAVLCQALEYAHRSGRIDPAYRVISYDVSSRFYADRSHAVGDATRELLPAEMLEHVEFRRYGTTADLRSDFPPNGVQFVFLDGLHSHPWPALDLLAALEVLAPGATVVLHDINLPLCHPEHPTWGAKLVYDELSFDKRADPAASLPNIGAVRVPDDKEGLRDELLRIVYDHPWESDVPTDITTKVFA